MSNSNPAFNAIFNRVARTTYVVIGRNSEGRLSLLQDPGMGKPWSSKNKKLADFHAKINKGEARTAEDAFTLLLKDNPNFERDLVARAEAKAHTFDHDLTKTINSKRNGKRS